MLSGKYTVSLKKLVSEFNLEELYLPADSEKIIISTSEVNRPGLHLSGFYQDFEPSRIQILGNMEFSYLSSLTQNVRTARIYSLMSSRIPAVVITDSLPLFPEMMDAAKEYGVPLLRTEDQTTSFMSSAIQFLNLELAPRITRHGVLVEIYGEGVLLMGDSGVGKSETAIELVKRGHRLIADDAVELRKVSNRQIIGSSPENIRHFLEVRGIGIINVRRLFGIGAVKMTEKVDMIVNMELWNPDKMYDRMGLETEYEEILGVRIPSLTIPIKPGRNTSILLEVAAMNNRQKRMGYNAAEELIKGLETGSRTDTLDTKDWDLR